MAFVIEVESEGILRRLLNNSEGAENLSFAKLEGRVRDLLKLPSTAQLKIIYKDKEDDDVTLTNDQELEDACVIQKLNPLRLQVVSLPPPDILTAETAPAERSSGEEPESVENHMSLETFVKKMVECYVPVFEGTFPSSQIPEVMDDIVKKVTARVSAATLTESAQKAESVNPSPETSLLTPLDWLRSLPPPSVSSELEKQDKTPAEAPAETSPVNSSAETAKEVVHNGVTCDMCNMNPITGIRYKATKRMNYDLCGRCFNRSGRADEYNRIEQPLSRPVWESNAVKMVRMSPGNAEGRSYTCTPPNLLAKLVLAANGGRCKPMKSC